MSSEEETINLLKKNMLKLKQGESFGFQTTIKGEVEFYAGNVPAEETIPRIFKIERLQ